MNTRNSWKENPKIQRKKAYGIKFVRKSDYRTPKKKGGNLKDPSHGKIYLPTKKEIMKKTIWF